MTKRENRVNARVAETEDGMRVAYVDDFALTYSDLESLSLDHMWITQKKAIEFFRKSKRTIQSWVHRYGVRKRVNFEGYVEYNHRDLAGAELRSRHRGGHPNNSKSH